MNTKNVRLVLGLLVAVCLIGANAYAKDYTVKELNSGPDGSFVFEPGFLHIQPGDSVHFVATDPGHSSKSFLVPQGAADWDSGISKDITVKFSKDGVYLYECVPHHTFGMLGVIQVGKAVNKAAADKSAQAMESQQVMNQGRLEKLMKEVK